MQQGYTALEGFLNCRGTGDREMDRPQLTVVQILVVRVIFVVVSKNGEGAEEGNRSRSSQANRFIENPTKRRV